MQWLKMLDLFLEDLGLAPTIHMATHNLLQLQFQGIPDPLLATIGAGQANSTQTHMEQNTHIVF